MKNKTKALSIIAVMGFLGGAFVSFVVPYDNIDDYVHHVAEDGGVFGPGVSAEAPAYTDCSYCRGMGYYLMWSGSYEPVWDDGIDDYLIGSNGIVVTKPMYNLHVCHECNSDGHIPHSDNIEYFIWGPTPSR